MAARLVKLLYEAWDNLDTAVVGLSESEAMERPAGCNSVAWSVGHVSQHVESWICRRFASAPNHPRIGDPTFHTGASGESLPWARVAEAVAEVRGQARRYLDGIEESDLDLTVPYEGSLVHLRAGGLSLQYALLRIASHHFIHLGEITTVRSLLGNPAPEDGTWGLRLL